MVSLIYKCFDKRNHLNIEEFGQFLCGKKSEKKVRNKKKILPKFDNAGGQEVSGAKSQ